MGENFSGPGNQALLEDIVSQSREKIWWPLFYKRQYTTGADLITALGGQSYIEFFTQGLQNQNLTNLNTPGQMPFAYGFDGLSLDVAGYDSHFETPFYYEVKRILLEHGRVEFVIRDNNTVADHPASMFPSARDISAGVATTQTSSQVLQATHGVPHLRNYHRFGGPDWRMGVMLSKNDNIVGRLHIDAVGLAGLTAIWGSEGQAEVSSLGIQIEMDMWGWAFRQLV